MEKGLLAAVYASLDDDAPRQVLADWLGERGDPRGELIALQIARARLAPKDWAKRASLEERADDLVYEHQKKWNKSLAKLGDELVYRRGFVERLRVPAKTLLAKPDALFKAAPSLRGVELGSDAIDDVLEDLGRGKQLLRFRELALTDAPASTGALARFMESPALAAIEELTFTDMMDVREGVATAMSRSRHLKKLRALRFENTLVGSVGLRTLLACKTLPALRELKLYHSNIQDAGAVAMAKATALKKLERLELGICDFTPKSVKAILHGALVEQLTYLALDHRLRKSGAQAVVSSPKLKKLQVLELGILGDDGARILAKAKNLPKVEWLHVAKYGIEEAGRQALEARFGDKLQIGED